MWGSAPNVIKNTKKEQSKMSKPRFYLCNHCKNLIGMIDDKGVPVVCCGEKMQPLEANTVEASREKHLPVVEVKGNVVSAFVGSVEHPMGEDHSIVWLYLETKNGGQRKVLEIGKPPRSEFVLAEGEEPVAVYAYCNLHGLWKTEI